MFKYRFQWATFFCFLYVFVLAIHIVMPSVVKAAEGCQYVTRTLTQNVVDAAADSGTIDLGPSGLEDTIDRLQSNVGNSWLFIECDDDITYILASDEFNEASNVIFFNPNTGDVDVLIFGDYRRLGTSDEGQEVSSVSVAEDFVTGVDDDGDGADIVPPTPPTDPSPTDPVRPSDGDEVDEEESKDCRDGTFPTSVAWAICAGLEWADDVIFRMTTTINNLLSVDPAEVNTDGMKEAWSYFRNIASVLLVIIGLVMIIGQAVSKE